LKAWVALDRIVDFHDVVLLGARSTSSGICFL
jgi:hypothetical protein